MLEALTESVEVLGVDVARDELALSGVRIFVACVLGAEVSHQASRCTTGGMFTFQGQVPEGLLRFQAFWSLFEFFGGRPIGDCHSVEVDEVGRTINLPYMDGPKLQHQARYVDVFAKELDRKLEADRYVGICMGNIASFHERVLWYVVLDLDAGLQSLLDKNLDQNGQVVLISTCIVIETGEDRDGTLVHDTCSHDCHQLTPIKSVCRVRFGQGNSRG